MASANTKILRVGVIQGGKIIEERHLRKREDVTLGQDSRNTFVLPASSLPPSFAVFEHREHQYHLVFTEGMEGRVRMGAADLDFAALRSQGLARKRGNVFVLPLTDQVKGKVSLGEVTLLFQFVTPPPAPAKVEMPDSIRGSLWKSMDRLFFGILALSLFLHFSGATCIALSPKPVDEELALDELPDRFAKVLIPIKQPEPEKTKDEPKTDEPKVEAKKDVKKKDKPAADPIARKAAIQKTVASKGLLKVLGSSGSGAGALQDVLGGSTGAGDIANAIQGAAGVAVADAASVGGPKGAASGRQAGIGDLGTSGGGNVKLSKGDVQVQGRVREEAPDVDSADVDRAALARYVKARLKAIQGCYERELKRNPSLKGKIMVRFAITHAGRPGSIDIEENSLNEAVGSCIKTVIRGWVFPFKPADDVTVSYPFVFSPAS